MKNIITAFLIFILISTASKAQWQSDESDKVWSIVMPLAKSTDIDMKQAILGTGRDSIVSSFIQNTGTYEFKVLSIAFRGPDANAFRLQSGFPPYTINPQDSAQAEFFFFPFKAGQHNAEIVIITQSDTLIQKITGEGLQPDIIVLDNLIDFGKVDVGSYRDSIKAVTIKNVGPAVISISRTENAGPNIDDFITLSGGGTFVLQPGDTCKMDLRFKPGKIGRANGGIKFHYQGVGSPALVQLFGEGITISPIITYQLAPIPNQICDITTQGNLEIKNIGYDTLRISDIKVKGSNASDFSVTPLLPIALKPDSSTKLAVNFKSMYSGLKNAELEIYSNSVPDSILKINLTAVKDSIELTPENYTIELGYLCPGESKDSTVEIRNTGSKTTSGFAKSDKIQLLDNVIRLEAGSTQTLGFTYTGSQTEGNFNEKIFISDSICGTTNEILIKGTVVLPKVQSTALSLTAKMGKTKDGIITIRNTGIRDIIIKDAPAVYPPFYILGSPFPLFIPANKSADINIRYIPISTQKVSSNITLFAEPCGINTTSLLTGESASVINFMLPETTATIGTYSCIPLYAKTETDFQVTQNTGYKAYISFDASLLLPDSDNKSTIVNSKRNIELKGIFNNINTVYTQIDSLCGTVLLANENKIILNLDSIEITDPNIENTKQPGSITIIGLCQRDIARLQLISNFDFVINSNPVTDFLEISGIDPMLKQGVDKVEIYDMLGIKINLTPTLSMLGEGVKIDVSGFVPGVYFVKIGDKVAKFVKM